MSLESRFERLLHEPSTPKMTQILIADDAAEFRRAMAAFLESTGDTQIIGEAINGYEAVKLAAYLRPEIIIMDISMPVLNGLRAARMIVDSVSNSKVIILSSHLDPEYIQEAISSGVSGYLFKPFTTDELMEAIHKVSSGGTYFASPKTMGETWFFQL